MPNDPAQPRATHVLRLIDANANRAREGLRVLEDYARFILNSDLLSGQLKNIRHELITAIGPLLNDAIIHRDVVGDVGTEIKTNSETKREDLNAVVQAAGKRLGEAMRTIEEYLKIFDPAAASVVEKLRYRFYSIEQSIHGTFHAFSRMDQVRLYVLITEKICNGDWFAAAEAAIRGGADCLQLREKELSAGEFLIRANRFCKLCRQHNVISIINDRPDIALLACADGVHLGQEDLPAWQARRLLGMNRIIGVSTHNIKQAQQAVLDSADYIGVGPVFRSATKTRDFVAGLEYASQAAKISIPSVAIAGITHENVDQVLATGIKAVAVTACVVGSNDIENSARMLKQKLTNAV